jgi:hypothetical protein
VKIYVAAVEAGAQEKKKTGQNWMKLSFEKVES